MLSFLLTHKLTLLAVFLGLITTLKVTHAFVKETLIRLIDRQISRRLDNSRWLALAMADHLERMERDILLKTADMVTEAETRTRKDLLRRLETIAEEFHETVREDRPLTDATLDKVLAPVRARVSSGSLIPPQVNANATAWERLNATEVEEPCQPTTSLKA